MSPTQSGAIEVVDHGEDFHLGIFRLEEGHHAVVDGARAWPFCTTSKNLLVWSSTPCSRPSGGEDVQPVGIQHVDLAGKIAQGREAGRVPGNIERGADAFFLIQLYLRGSQLRLAVGAAGQLLLALAGLLFFVLLQSLEGAFLRRKQQFGQGLVAQRGVDKEKHQRARAQPLKRRTGDGGASSGRAGDRKRRLQPWKANCSSYAACGKRSIRQLREDRVQATVECLLRYTFPPSEQPQTRYIRKRAGTGAEACAVLFGASLAALALRLFFVFHFPGVVDDSRLYADIARNWLQHGVYGITNSGQIMPTLSRLPGYPAFLAAIFAVFGVDNFRAVLLIQVLFDLATCFLMADLARRLFSARAAMAAFLLAGLCPFLADYAAAALTETLEIFFTTLALDLAVCGLETLRQQDDSSTRLSPWIGCGLSIGAAILLRPDGGILLAAIGGYLLLLLVMGVTRRSTAAPGTQPRSIVRAGLILAVSALAPLAPWTWRNLHTLHRFEPLAPRYANDSDEAVMPGFNRWVKTWLAEYVSVEEIYWNVPGETIDVDAASRPRL